MKVYAIEPYTYVYGQHAVGHKQGKAFPGREMTVIGEWGGDWLEIEPLELDRDVSDDYPNYWVNAVDIVYDGPDIPEVDVSFSEVVVALEILKAWWKQ